MVAIASDTGIGATFDLARRVRVAIPDRFAAAVDIGRAFDLIGRCCRAPKKTFGEIADAAFGGTCCRAA